MELLAIAGQQPPHHCGYGNHNGSQEANGRGLSSMPRRLKGLKESAAFQIVLKRRAHILLIAFVSVQNIRQFVAVIAS
jgi:hypothetical protein